jgi:hypothetical protein
MNISAVNGKDEISWISKNSTKKQKHTSAKTVRRRTIKVPGKNPFRARY